MLKKILILVAVLVVLFLGVMAALPSDYQVRSARDFEADHDQVLGYLSDLGNWPDWLCGGMSEADRAACHFEFSASTKGPGAWLRFDHDELSGRLEILRIDPQVGIFYRLEVADFPAGEGQIAVLQRSKGAITTAFMVSGPVPFLQRPLVPSFQAALGRWFDARLEALEKRFGAGD
ncbi:MAG: SRPBCC family protein [Planctomycetes bacterium]|nr:SRPBCC family protein [Planctomycetota bacterium]